MAVIRIDNLTDDSVVIELDNKEYSIEEDATVSIQNIEKGNYNLTVKRRKDRSDEVVIRQENSGDLIDKMKVNEKSHHVQICSEFLINLNSSKSVITLKKNISGSSKGGMDIIFSSFDINATGAKIENKKEYFSNKNVKNNFVKYFLYETFLPVGIGSIILIIISLYALIANISGNAVNLGGTKFTYPFSFGLLAISLSCLGYYIYSLIRGISIIKKYKKK